MQFQLMFDLAMVEGYMSNKEKDILRNPVSFLRISIVLQHTTAAQNGFEHNITTKGTLAYLLVLSGASRLFQGVESRWCCWVFPEMIFPTKNHDVHCGIPQHCRILSNNSCDGDRSPTPPGPFLPHPGHHWKQCPHELSRGHSWEQNSQLTNPSM